MGYHQDTTSVVWYPNSIKNHRINLFLHLINYQTERQTNTKSKFNSR
ncbi:hypothetical protein SLEP1_g17305 [Rubroshorea leprosula]|uniref:Uncharacterized protein n=1 Tax=Rubroshorea leprosula TaxID=152421 RepID=A0AAV5IXJ4_9ROSI|nr:hypothetical protein SLEP1_g17305 [Rubroshorea leprosula]